MGCIPLAPRTIDIHARTGDGYSTRHEGYNTQWFDDIPDHEHERVNAALDAALDDAMTQLEATLELRRRAGQALEPTYEVGLVVDSRFELTVPVWEVGFRAAWLRFLVRWEHMGHGTFWTYKSVAHSWNKWNVFADYRSVYVVTLHTIQPAQ
jgi:hypothetical protein